MYSESTESGTVERSLESVRFVGPATAAVLEGDDYDATAITEKQVSYRLLVEAGVNPGVAAKIRREHSLSWSFSSGGDLDRRSAQVTGLGTAEAEWVAASAGDWAEAADEQTAETQTTDEQGQDDEKKGDQESSDEPTGRERTPWPTHGESVATAPGTDQAADAATDGSGDAISAEAAWRERSKPTPVTELDAVGDDAAAQLAEAGINSVRSLATADPEHVADVLELSVGTVREWYHAAQSTHDHS